MSDPVRPSRPSHVIQFPDQNGMMGWHHWQHIGSHLAPVHSLYNRVQRVPLLKREMSALWQQCKCPTNHPGKPGSSIGWCHIRDPPRVATTLPDPAIRCEMAPSTQRIQYNTIMDSWGRQAAAGREVAARVWRLLRDVRDFTKGTVFCLLFYFLSSSISSRNPAQVIAEENGPVKEHLWT